MIKQPVCPYCGGYLLVRVLPPYVPTTTQCECKCGFRSKLYDSPQAAVKDLMNPEVALKYAREKIDVLKAENEHIRQTHVSHEAVQVILDELKKAQIELRCGKNSEAETLRAYRVYVKDDSMYILYEFDTEEEMDQSGLLDDKRRTSCFMSAEKYYVEISYPLRTEAPNEEIQR